MAKRTKQRVKNSIDAPMRVGSTAVNAEAARDHPFSRNCPTGHRETCLSHPPSPEVLVASHEPILSTRHSLLPARAANNSPAVDHVRVRTCPPVIVDRSSSSFIPGSVTASTRFYTPSMTTAFDLVVCCLRHRFQHITANCSAAVFYRWLHHEPMFSTYSRFFMSPQS